MLNKINNISAGSEYSKSSRQAAFNGSIAAGYSRRADMYDSVDISPALQFLNNVKWRLKEFKHSANEKLFLDFIISDIEFQTTLDLVNITSLTELNYNLIKNENSEIQSGKIFTDLASKLGEIRYDKQPELINFSATNVFFSRVLDLRIYRELNSADAYVINELVRGITNGIKNEFDLLNNQIFIFLDKLINVKVESHNKAMADFNEAITIKSIKVLNAK